MSNYEAISSYTVEEKPLFWIFWNLRIFAVVVIKDDCFGNSFLYLERQIPQNIGLSGPDPETNN
jgi:hypothetical protein